MIIQGFQEVGSGHSVSVYLWYSCLMRLSPTQEVEAGRARRVSHGLGPRVALPDSDRHVVQQHESRSACRVGEGLVTLATCRVCRLSWQHGKKRV